MSILFNAEVKIVKRGNRDKEIVNTVVQHVTQSSLLIVGNLAVRTPIEFNYHDKRRHRPGI